MGGLVSKKVGVVMGEMIKAYGTIRKLWPTDLPSFRAHLLRLDPDSRHSRFGMGASDDFIARYAARCFTLPGVTFGYFEDGVLRGAAELRDMGQHSQIDEAHDGEAAFSIEQDWRGRGIGSLLFRKVITAARNRHMKRLYTSCLAYNRSMQALARKFKADLTFETDEVLGVLEAPDATSATQFNEALDDATGFATAVLDLQRRWFNPFQTFRIFSPGQH